MAQAANIVINDGQATPVATTFAPVRISPEASLFADRSSGVSLAFRLLKIGTKLNQNGRANDSALMIFECPVTSTVNGVTTLVGVNRSRHEFSFIPASTAAMRNDMYAFVKNGLANALIQGALRDLDPLY